MIIRLDLSRVRLSALAWYSVLYAPVAIGVVSNTLLARYFPKIEGANLGFHCAGIFVIIIPIF